MKTLDQLKLALQGVPKSVRELVLNGTYTPYEIRGVKEEFVIGTNKTNGVLIDAKGSIVDAVKLNEFDLTQIAFYQLPEVRKYGCG